MKYGLGDIQKYLTGADNARDRLWDGSNDDGFFKSACMEWQDREGNIEKS